MIEMALKIVDPIMAIILVLLSLVLLGLLILLCVAFCVFIIDIFLEWKKERAKSAEKREQKSD